MSLVYDLDALASTTAQVTWDGKKHDVHVLTVAEIAGIEADTLRRQIPVEERPARTGTKDDPPNAITFSERAAMFDAISIDEDTAKIELAIPSLTPDQIKQMSPKVRTVINGIMLDTSYGTLPDPNAKGEERPGMRLAKLIRTIRQPQ